LPFSIVGDNAGIRMLMGMLTSQDILAHGRPDLGKANQNQLGDPHPMNAQRSASIADVALPQAFVSGNRSP
jgi:hypothetical protein